MPSLTVTDRDGIDTTLELQAGKSVMEVLRDAGQAIEAACGGCCSCATCHVYIDDHWLEAVGPRSAMEEELVETTDHFDPARSRLSCQIRCQDALDGLRLTLAPEE